MNYLCPICGYQKLDEEAFSKLGDGSQQICPCCGNQFGYNAFPNNITELRKKRIKDGSKFRSTSKPAGRDAHVQLRNLSL